MVYFTYYGSVELKGKSDDFLKKCTKNESNKYYSAIWNPNGTIKNMDLNNDALLHQHSLMFWWMSLQPVSQIQG